VAEAEALSNELTPDRRMCTPPFREEWGWGSSQFLKKKYAHQRRSAGSVLQTCHSFCQDLYKKIVYVAFDASGLN
jgi:hypothetical protein